MAPGWVLSFTGEAGDIFGWGGDPVFLQDRYFVGGDNLRGFAPAGIGPRDEISQDALGGNKFYTGSITESMPLGLPKELGINGRIWTDFGTLWGNDQKNQTFSAAAIASDIAAVSPAGAGKPSTPNGPRKE